MNLASFIDAAPVVRPSALASNGMLGAAEDIDQKAWEDYVVSLRDQTVTAWNEASRSYLTLQKVRETLGLKFIATSAEQPIADQEGALTEAENQRWLELSATVQVMTQIADDAISGIRSIGYDPVEGVVIEALPGDNVRVVVQNDQPVIVDLQDQVVHTTSPVTGTVGLAPLAWLVLTAIVALSAYFTTDTVCNSMQSSAEQKTLRTLSKRQNDLVAGGKATPAEAKALTDSILLGARDLKVAGAELETAKSEGGLGKTVTTVAYVALGIVGLLVVAQVIPLLVRRPAAVAA